jgi:hypothetical protein
VAAVFIVAVVAITAGDFTLEGAVRSAVSLVAIGVIVTAVEFIWLKARSEPGKYYPRGPGGSAIL